MGLETKPDNQEDRSRAGYSLTAPDTNQGSSVSEMAASDAGAAKFSRISALAWFAGMLILLVPMVTLIDVPVARWFLGNELPRELGDALELTRIFSHGSGVGLVLIGIFLMSTQCRWQLPRLATLALGAGAIATLAKMFVLRPRPAGLNLDVASIDSAWLWAFDWSLSQVATFDASTRAFPSGDVATATALTVGLWIVLPRGRWLFVSICLGTFLQRLTSSAHFPSDILGGAAFGLLWAFACFHPKLLGNFFDKLQPESEPRRRGMTPVPLSVYTGDETASRKTA